MRVEEAFGAAGLNIAGDPIPDSLIRATCPNCAHVERLDRMNTTDMGAQTNYECAECSATVVIVGPAPSLTGGHRLGDNVVLPLGGMEIVVPGPNQPPP